MSIALTDEQRALAEAVAGFVERAAPTARTREAFDGLAAGERPAHWPELVAQGLHAVHLVEDVGGQGGDLADLAVVLEQVGRLLLPGPFVPTVLAGAVAGLAPEGDARTGLLTALAGGATAALVPLGAGLRASPADDGWVLSGRTDPVAGLLAAEVLVVGAEGPDGPVWLRLDAAAAHPVVEQGVDLTRDLGRLELDGLAVGAAADLGAIDAETAGSAVVALLAAEAAGVMRWCVGAAVEHVATREQFGRPVGSFQAVKHKAARLLVATELAAAAAWDAVRSLGQDPDQRRIAVAGAAVTAIGAAADAALEAVTLFGGIGYTWEHDAHLYWRRALGIAAATGPADRWTATCGEAGLRVRRTAELDLPVLVDQQDPAFRAGVAAALDDALELPEPGERHAALVDAGLVSPHWPAPWGRGASAEQQVVIAQEYARRGLVPPTTVIGEWAVPTILAHGTDEQKRRFARPTLLGEVVWCQLFSEPGAGSDLASLATRATKVDGGWRLTGQKVWTSGAHEADWGICLARTDPEAPKHKGLGYFLVDMRSPGVDVRPLRQATGAAHFTEVFLDEVFVPDGMLVGEPGQGWRLATTTLANERVAISSSLGAGRTDAVRELLVKAPPGPERDAGVRAFGLLQARAAAIAALTLRETLRRIAGEQPGVGSSVAKVASAELSRSAATAVVALGGPEAAARSGPRDPADVVLSVPAQLLGGGTVEIQLNVIAERILRLPRG